MKIKVQDIRPGDIVYLRNGDHYEVMIIGPHDKDFVLVLDGESGGWDLVCDNNGKAVSHSSDCDIISCTQFTISGVAGWWTRNHHYCEVGE